MKGSSRLMGLHKRNCMLKENPFLLIMKYICAQSKNVGKYREM